ncbi:MAG TPA: hypothetical protein VHA82_04720 [Ramlibacter sp.]|uniref:hypothetical protein n=1 Tax=Ramlibacter sp. TaxID=1917967 RepID=UPI002C14F887|nr:hypothetical protein [Ramlibacter sp.]HVZ43093.1 hypothetical protein [Ramlibacter sp.]
MSFDLRHLVRLLPFAALALPGFAGAQSLSVNYDITHPVRIDSDLLPDAMLSLGQVRIGSSRTYQGHTGAGLSMEAGRQWFGRLTIGHSLEASQLSLGGGFRWGDGQSVSLQLTARNRPQERLGLSVRYDWPRYYLRLGFDPRSHLEGTVDTLRFSAGMRF